MDMKPDSLLMSLYCLHTLLKELCSPHSLNTLLKELCKFYLIRRYLSARCVEKIQKALEQVLCTSTVTLKS